MNSGLRLSRCGSDSVCVCVCVCVRVHRGSRTNVYNSCSERPWYPCDGGYKTEMRSGKTGRDRTFGSRSTRPVRVRVRGRVKVTVTVTGEAEGKGYGRG